MTRNSSSATFGLVASAFLALALSARADFIVQANSPDGAAVLARVRDDGQLVQRYELPDLNLAFTSLGGIGPDGNLYLIADNYATPPTFGVVRLNLQTGELLDNLQTPFTGTSKIPSLQGAHRLAFAPNGDVFLLGGGPDPGGSEYGLDAVHRIDRLTGLSKSVYTEVEPYGFSDLAVRTVTGGAYDAEVFITEGYGSLTHWLSSDVDSSLSGNPPANSSAEFSGIGQSFARTMEFGTDGRLYFRTDSSKIWRYDLEANIGSEFVASIPNPFSSSIISLGGHIAFGPEGDLYAIRHGSLGTLTAWDSVVYRYDGTTGAFLGTALDNAGDVLGTIGDLIYLPVPEPDDLRMLIVAGLGSIAILGRRGAPISISA